MNTCADMQGPCIQSAGIIQRWEFRLTLIPLSRGPDDRKIPTRLQGESLLPPGPVSYTGSQK